jgi:hypothetical protein
MIHQINRKMSASKLDGIVVRRGPAARDALRTAIELHAAATAELTASQAPEQRLIAIVHELATVEHDLTACRAEDQRIFGAWLADGAEGKRPRPSAQTLAAERAVTALGRDAVAARAALAEHQVEVQVCAARVRDSGIARSDAAYLAAALYANSWTPSSNRRSSGCS